jgi:hypothetical protein
VNRRRVGRSPFTVYVFLTTPDLSNRPQVLAIGAGEDVAAVGAGHEIEIPHVGWI